MHPCLPAGYGYQNLTDCMAQGLDVRTNVQVFSMDRPNDPSKTIQLGILSTNGGEQLQQLRGTASMLHVYNAVSSPSNLGWAENGGALLPVAVLRFVDFQHRLFRATQPCPTHLADPIHTSQPPSPPTVSEACPTSPWSDECL